MLMVTILVPSLIAVIIVRKIYLKKGQSRAQYENSTWMKLYIFLLTTIPDIIEASLLTILITNYLFWEQSTFFTDWDKVGLLLLFFVDFCLIYLQVYQQILANSQIS